MNWLKRLFGLEYRINMGRAGDYLRDEKSPDNKEKFGNPKSVEEIVEALRKLDGKQARNEEEPG